MDQRIIRRTLLPVTAFLLATSLLLAGCGNKGSLTLPPRDIATGKQAQKTPATPSSSSAQSPIAPADHSSTPTPQSQ